MQITQNKKDLYKDFCTTIRVPSLFLSKYPIWVPSPVMQPLISWFYWSNSVRPPVSVACGPGTEPTNNVRSSIDRYPVIRKRSLGAARRNIKKQRNKLKIWRDEKDDFGSAPPIVSKFAIVLFHLLGDHLHKVQEFHLHLLPQGRQKLVGEAVHFRPPWNQGALGAPWRHFAAFPEKSADFSLICLVTNQTKWKWLQWGFLSVVNIPWL